MLQLLKGVTPRAFDKASASTVQLPRQFHSFKYPFKLAKMFIERTVCNLYQDDFSMFSFVFDMNQLFEEYVFRLLYKNKEKLGLKTVSYQKGKRLVSHERNFQTDSEFKERPQFSTFSDIYVVTQDDRHFILDTKYKLISESKPHLGVSNADVYQVLAYSKIHAISGPVIPVLLYPQFKSPISRSYRITNTDDEVWVSTVDLNTDLTSSSESILDELEVIFRGGQSDFDLIDTPTSSYGNSLETNLSMRKI
jgi:5-methylcytosine-specific restriction enzyme subunit McrC